MNISCNKANKERIIAETIGQQIELDFIKPNHSRFIILRYISRPACTSCQLKLGIWKAYQKKLKRHFGDKVNICFICETININEANNLFKMYGFKSVLVDSVVNFYESTNLNSALGKDVVFLLDSTYTILSIGNPNENIKVDSLYKKIILDKLNTSDN